MHIATEQCFCYVISLLHKMVLVLVLVLTFLPCFDALMGRKRKGDEKGEYRGRRGRKGSGETGKEWKMSRSTVPIH